MSAPSVAAAAPSITFTGRGNGHGIGLSQYGAKGFAEHGTLPNGKTATGGNIAAYYFPGSAVVAKPSSTDKSIAVNLDTAVTPATSRYSRAQWKISPGSSTSVLKINETGGTLPWAGAPFSFTGSGSSILVTDKNGKAVSGSPFKVITLVSGGSPAVITVNSTSGFYNNTNARYRGQLLLTASSGKIRLANKLSMQQYLYGVVPHESPASWPAAALDAQAIVARSYAYTSSGELCCNTWSQVYRGYSYEDARTNAAVDRTVRQYVTYGGTVIKTFFCSSSGGHTANIEDVWLVSTPRPYYKGVDDPYCASPYDPWSPRTVSAMTLAAEIAERISGEPAGAGKTVYVKGLSMDRAASGFVRRADVYWSNGAVTRGVSGDAVRGAARLPSTKYYIGGPYRRIALGDRYSTAAAISRSAFPAAGSAAVAVVVNGTDAKFPDALSASSLGGVANGPVLLTRGDVLTAAARGELARLKPAKVYVIGGAASVTPAVFSAVRSTLPASSVVRIAGSDRYEVSAKVALEVKALGAVTKSVMVASGEQWADSAIAAAAAATAKRPLLLVSSRGVPATTAAAMRAMGVSQTAVFGGQVTLPAPVIAQLLRISGETAPYKRFGVSGTRYNEAVSAANWLATEFGVTLTEVFVASGETFPDSVTGGVLAARSKHPLLLSARAVASAATVAYLQQNRTVIDTVTVLGGSGSVSDQAAAQLGGAAY